MQALDRKWRSEEKDRRGSTSRIEGGGRPDEEARAFSRNSIAVYRQKQRVSFQVLRMESGKKDAVSGSDNHRAWLLEEETSSISL